jgi:hypothetical protein
LVVELLLQDPETFSALQTIGNMYTPVVLLLALIIAFTAKAVTEDTWPVFFSATNVRILCFISFPVAPAITAHFVSCLQGISGVSADEFAANKEAFTTILQEGIAASMTGVTSDEIFEVQISTVTTDDDSSGEGRRLTTSTMTVLSYDVRLWSNTRYAQYYINQLATASNNGALQSNIVAAAGTTSLANIVVSSFEGHDRLYKRGSSVLLTGTQIAGLVIGIVLFLVLFAFVVSFIVANKIHSAAATTAAAYSPAKQAHQEP